MVHFGKQRGIRQLYNKRFQTLFLKYCALVMAAVVLPLVAAVLCLYAFGNRLLLTETDNANYRGLVNTKSTLDAIFLDTESILYRHTVSEDIQTFVSTQKEVHPDYNYFAAANRILRLMQAGRRSYLDHSISIYSSVNDYSLSTISGGQGGVDRLFPEFIARYSEAYSDQREERYSSRWSSANPWSEPLPLLTIYRPIEPSVGPAVGFIAVDIDQRKLTNYLMSNTSNHHGRVLIADSMGLILYDSSQLKEQLPSGSISDFLRAGEELEQFAGASEGALTLRHGDSASRLSWINGGSYGWKYVQIIPFDDYVAGMRELRRVLVLVILVGLVLSVGIAYSVTRRMFRPLGDILHIVENPQDFAGSTSKDDEIQFLLINILESFQKNITLEEEMVSRKSALRSARAKALQEQIAPHFLYNSLQSIHWLAVEETRLEDSRTGGAIITLSRLVRACMEDSGNLVTVAEELDYIQGYMELARLRYGESLRCHIRVDPEALSCPILRLSLQPLVENAVSHGIQPKGGAGNISIAIQLLDGGNRLRAMVEDDGVGMEQERIDEIIRRCDTEFIYTSKHVGLVNLSQRLKLVYGDEYALALSAGQAGGIKVEFTLPSR